MLRECISMLVLPSWSLWVGFYLLGKHPFWAPPRCIIHVLQPSWRLLATSLLHLHLSGPKAMRGTQPLPQEYLSCCQAIGAANNSPHKVFKMTKHFSSCCGQRLLCFHGTVAAKLCYSWKTRWKCSPCDAYLIKLCKDIPLSRNMWQSETLQLCKLAQLVFGSPWFSNVDLVNQSIFRMLFHLSCSWFYLVCGWDQILKASGLFSSKSQCKVTVGNTFPKNYGMVVSVKKEMWQLSPHLDSFCNLGYITAQ